MIFAAKFDSRYVALLLGLLLAAGMPSKSIAGREERSVKAGSSWEFQIEGNPSTGYIWRLNEGESENPAIVKVEDLGYGEPETKLLGAPAPYRFRITGLTPGFAKLHFEYLRPWIGKPDKTEDLWVRVEE